MSSSSLLDLSSSVPASTLKRPTSLSRHASAAGFPLSPAIPRSFAKSHKPHIACSPCETTEGSLIEPEDISQLLADVACFADRLENLKDAVLREGKSLSAILPLWHLPLWHLPPSTTYIRGVKIKRLPPFHYYTFWEFFPGIHSIPSEFQTN